MDQELKDLIEATDRAGFDLPVRVEQCTMPQMPSAFDIVESDARRTRIAIAGARPDADLIAAALNAVLSAHQRVQRCAYDDCEYEVVDSVEITLPGFLGPFRLLHDDERKRRVPVCAEHGESLRAYFVIEHLALAFTLVDPGEGL